RTDLHRLDHLVRRDVDDEHRAIFFGRDPDTLILGFDRNAFRLLADLEAFDDRARIGVHDARLRGILVGDVDVRAVGADGELLRIRTAREHLDQLSLIEIDDADAVRLAIRGRQ